MTFFKKNHFDSPESPGFLLAFGALSVAFAFGIYASPLKQWKESEKFSFRHSYLWMAFVCFLISGSLSGILSICDSQVIAFTEAKCIDYNCAYTFFLGGVAFIAFWLVAIFCDGIKRIIINTKDQIYEKDTFKDKLIVVFCVPGRLLSETALVLIGWIESELNKIKKALERIRKCTKVKIYLALKRINRRR